MLLILLHLNTPILPIARVNLRALHIRLQTQLDSRARIRHTKHLQIRVLRRSIPRSIEDEAVVDARAAGAAVVLACGGVNGGSEFRSAGFGEV